MAAAEARADIDRPRGRSAIGIDISLISSQRPRQSIDPTLAESLSAAGGRPAWPEPKRQARAIIFAERAADCEPRAQASRLP